ncbi:TatD family hydrolase [Acinetobacter radioresistens]|uniref:TatD family hydrolase n=1 Tax=Acinetobacter radioresistens TaxID=40216 RepID=UPI000C31E403|nr:TatD family hydrolase [Acinetobacter radioresistens]MCM1936296.1 TatD family hydrolase [Acinetobacter radioresistens]MCM1953074.1 TatD family hydrolase [Acinetobacter radioresistens]MCU4308960.1 TatD family hydrolase [Acinetobacter radioresistens]MCU4567008.1 TatD family hydrolase [Acinetobacter radioresistens]PKH28700.1 TatD family deoxyribonuclease [Acinetobacter radioresistens]
MFVDTHCHLTLLDLSPYDGDIDLAIQAAKDARVSKMMSISVNLDDHIELSRIATRHPELGYSVGVHPCEDATVMARATTEYLVELAQAEKAWALGETGLDYFHSTDFIAEQKECFARHIQASKIVKKPVVVHTRSAKQDTVDIIRAEGSEHGILHCFTEDWETAKAVLDCGYYISFSGIVSFKNAQDLRDVAKQVPLDRILIETDSPYLAPVPYRGKSNEPKYVPYVAKALSDVYDKPLEEIAFITTQNFENLLNSK